MDIGRLTVTLKGMAKYADDMPMFKGERQYGNRGLVWHRFNPGAFSKLPEVLDRVLNQQAANFRANYAKFATNPKTGKPYSDFRGMVFTIYAEDRSITPEIEAKIPPELNRASSLVKQHEIKLPPLDERPDKTIGSDYWLSHYAYAWKDQYPDDIVFDENKQDSGRPREIRPLTNAKFQETNEYGPLVIDRTPGGFGLFVQTNSGRKEPVYIGQSAAGLTKFFEGNLAPNQSVVYMPNGPQGQIVPARFPKHKSKWDANHHQMANDNSKLHRFIINQDNTIAVQTDEGESPLSQEQIQQIVPRLGADFYIVEGKNVPGAMANTGPWRMSERLKNHLQDPNLADGFASLSNLRAWLEEVRPGIHTPIEGYKVITIGPMFTSPIALEEGKSLGGSNFATDLTKVNPSEITENPVVEINRGVKWVIVANEFSEARMSAIGRSTTRPAQRSAGESERAESFPTAADAIKEVKARYLGTGANTGKVLSEMAASVQYAEKALAEAARAKSLEQANTSMTPPVTENIPVKTEKPPMPASQPNPAPVLKPKTIQPPSNTANIQNWIYRRIHG